MVEHRVAECDRTTDSLGNGRYTDLGAADPAISAMSSRRECVGAALLVLLLGTFAGVITDWQHGLLTALFIAMALIVSKNL